MLHREVHAISLWPNVITSIKCVTMSTQAALDSSTTMYNNSIPHPMNLTGFTNCNATEICKNFSARKDELVQEAEDADDAIWILTSTFIIFTMQSGKELFKMVLKAIPIIYRPCSREIRHLV